MKVICSYCHQEVEHFYKSGTRTYKNGNIRQEYKCRECNTKFSRYKNRTEHGKSLIVKSNRKYQKENPARTMAWRKVRTIPLQPCEVCGDTKTHRHHPDPKIQLEIVFLCPLHHKQAHMLQ